MQECEPASRCGNNGLRHVAEAGREPRVDWTSISHPEGKQTSPVSTDV